jgi:exopolyphosphatase / guanosine-5'-triphosphate,3'-diphosphate pyrophosphatase
MIASARAVEAALLARFRPEIKEQGRFDKAMDRRHASDAHLLREGPSWYTCVDSGLDIAAAVEPWSGFGAAGRNSMKDEGRATGSLDSAVERVPQRRSRWARRSPYGFPNNGGRAQDGGGHAAPTYAALDLGTNNCRLLIARPSGDSFRVVDAFSRIIRLGEGVSTSGRISDAAVGRAVDALAICRDKMRQRGVTRARLIATEACRAAANGGEFRARIAEEVGLELEIIDRETEATLAATGCTPLIDPDAETVLLFDIGGGSSELVRLDRSPPAGRGPPPPRIKAWVSLPVGVVTLAERHGGHVVTPEIYEAMIAEVAAFLEAFVAEHGGLGNGQVHLLGTSGTVTTIAGVHLELRRYERRRVDGCWMVDHEVTKVIERLLTWSYEDRVANACIGAERADLVLAGCAILDAIRRAFPCQRLRVADRGLREGMLVQMMRDDGVWGGEARAP